MLWWEVKSFDLRKSVVAVIQWWIAGGESIGDSIVGGERRLLVFLRGGIMVVFGR